MRSLGLLQAAIQNIDDADNVRPIMQNVPFNYFRPLFINTILQHQPPIAAPAPFVAAHAPNIAAPPDGPCCAKTSTGKPCKLRGIPQKHCNNQVLCQYRHTDYNPLIGVTQQLKATTKEIASANKIDANLYEIIEEYKLNWSRMLLQEVHTPPPVLPLCNPYLHYWLEPPIPNSRT